MVVDKDLIKNYIIQELIKDKDIGVIDSTFPLLENGVIDSLGIQKLVSYLEETFSLKIEDEDIVPDNFDNLESIYRFVEKKLWLLI